MDPAALLRRSIDNRGEAVEPVMTSPSETYVFACRYGKFSIRLDHRAAPETSAFFAQVFAGPYFDDASIFRIVTERNSSVRKSVPIEVIQFGLDHDGKRPFDGIVHESTAQTGLRHLRWSVSAARYGQGEAYASCFICMRDEPELDDGGKRHGDGAGFAVFGQVTSGFETLEQVFGQAEATDYLSERIPLQLC